MISQNHRVWGGRVSKGSVTVNERDLFVFLGFAAAAVNFSLSSVSWLLCFPCLRARTPASLSESLYLQQSLYKRHFCV